MKLTNYQIYIATQTLEQAFQNNSNNIIPIKLGFYLSKNLNELKKLYNEIEESRNNIIITYGEVDIEDPTKINFTDEKRDIANAEIQTLFSLEQEVNLYEFTISDIEDLKLELNQINSLLFLIKEQ